MSHNLHANGYHNGKLNCMCDFCAKRKNTWAKLFCKREIDIRNLNAEVRIVKVRLKTAIGKNLSRNEQYRLK